MPLIGWARLRCGLVVGTVASGEARWPRQYPVWVISGGEVRRAVAGEGLPVSACEMVERVRDECVTDGDGRKGRSRREEMWEHADGSDGK